MTETDWYLLFHLRVKIKQGMTPSQEQFEGCLRAYKEDPKRYREMEADVFEASAPYGSNVKAKRGEP